MIFFLYVCVIVCQLFHDIPTNVTKKTPDEDEPANHSDVGFINPFAVWFQNACGFCYNEWEASYVENASLYTSFLLFTRASELNYTVVNISDPQLLFGAGFNSSKSTKVLIHGWMDNATIDFAEDLKFSYLLAQDVNIVSVNWAGMSQTFYPLSRRAVTPVGRYTAKFVDFLVSEVGVSSASIHILGHSLGAHIAGVVGESVTFGNLSRITGLDPAAPLFGSDPEGRLDPTDAQFVDVIHSAGGYVGYYKPCGHVDFYPNGGDPIQPGCGVDIGFCSHKRSYLYFAESITSLGFISTVCDSWHDYKRKLCQNHTKNVLGEHVDQRFLGVYYLYTNPSSPFGAWNNSVSM
uniref:Lipase domain-containing protein n=1 Tax=Graphocephala atropunctata TaxID=36148 RepID=A0A1B6MCA6_9HEMI